MMLEKQYIDWLKKKGKSIDGYPRYIEAVEKHFSINIDNEFDNDGCLKLLNDIARSFVKKTASNYSAGVRSYIAFKNESINRPLPNKKASGANRVIGPQRIKPALRQINHPKYGYDIDGLRVTYAKKVNQNDRVPGLVEFLEHEYDILINFSNNFFVNDRSFEPISIILSPDTPCDTYEFDELTIFKLIKRDKRFNDVIPSLADISDFFRLSMRVCGKFVRPHINRYRFIDGDEWNWPHIVIYYNNIDYHDQDSFEALLRLVLSHEYMHFINWYLESKARNPMPYYVKCYKKVSEALADFYSVVYSIHRGTVEPKSMLIARARYEFWEQYFDTPVPYPEALWFLYINKSFDTFGDLKNRCLVDIHNEYTGKFKEVLYTAIHRSYAKAYDVLIS